MKKINIAIDGVSGAGKSTTAKEIAKRLGYKYVDTGSMYRCVALLVIEKNLDPTKLEENKGAILNNFDYDVKDNKIFLNGKDVTLEIRSVAVNEMLPNIVAIPFVRQFLVHKQQEIGKSRGVIMDGRDIGSVVLKDAELKIYQIADASVRAQRRYEENLEKGIESNYEEILENFKKRDYTDTYVSKALVKVPDAIEIDTTNMPFEDVVNYILKLVEERAK